MSLPQGYPGEASNYWHQRYQEASLRVAALEQAIRHVVNDSPGTPASVKQYLTAALEQK